MGVYDIVEGQQIKSTPSPSLKSYSVGDHIPLPDGCHLTHEGAFIVRDKHVVATTEVVYTKWGDIVNPQVLLHPWDHLSHLLDYDPMEFMDVEERRNAAEDAGLCTCGHGDAWHVEGENECVHQAFGEGFTTLSYCECEKWVAQCPEGGGNNTTS